VKFGTEVKGWLRYKTVKKYYRQFQPPEYGVPRTNVTDDRRICDSKDSNVTVQLSQSRLRKTRQNAADRSYP